MLGEDIVLLSDTLSAKISNIGQLFFNYNRLLDAGMDFLDIDMNMNMMSEYIHKNIAHKAPLDADAFRDYNASKSKRTNYLNPILGSSGDYELDPLKFFSTSYLYAQKIQEEIKSGIEMAMQESDIETCEFLKSQIPNIGKYKAQFVLLYDKCEASINAGNTWQDIDNRWEDFVKMGG
jgi:phosphomevalonate kinase